MEWKLRIPARRFLVSVMHRQPRLLSRLRSSMPGATSNDVRPGLTTCAERETSKRKNTKYYKAPRKAYHMKQARSQRAPSAVPSGKKSAGKKSTSGSAADASKAKYSKEAVARPTAEQVALRAYFIAERRRSLGTEGDETSDWIAAEQELIEELKAV
jgi:hypothetical protein